MGASQGGDSDALSIGKVQSFLERFIAGSGIADPGISACSRSIGKVKKLGVFCAPKVLACGGGIALTRSDAVEGRAKQVSAQEVIREGQILAGPPPQPAVTGRGVSG